MPAPEAGWADWTVATNGIYFAAKNRVNFSHSSYRIHFFDFATGETTEVLRREGPNDHSSLTVSPDAEWLLFAEDPIGIGVLILAENFR